MDSSGAVEFSAPLKRRQDDDDVSLIQNRLSVLPSSHLGDKGIEMQQESPQSMTEEYLDRSLTKQTELETAQVKFTVKPSDSLPLGSSCPNSATRGFPATTTLSAEQLRRGAVNLNGAARFRSLLGKLQSKTVGQKLNILVVGGSVENPNFQVAFAQKWPSLVAKWLGGSSSSGVEAVLTSFDMQAHTQQMSSSTNFAMDVDWQKMLNSSSKYDLVFIAGSVNSPLKGKPGFAAGDFSLVKDATVRKSFDEAVLRSLLEHAKSPAVMFLNWFYDKAFFEAQQATIQAGDPGPTFLSTNGLEWKYGTWEDDSYNFLSTYYEISMVSGRSALLHSTDLDSVAGASLGPRFKSTDVFIEGLHPTILGHALLSQVVQFAICEQFHMLQESPSASNALSTAAQMPPAVFANAEQQLAMRHAADLSGYPSLEEHSKVHSSATPKIPSTPLFVIPENPNASKFNRTGNSSMLPWDLRVTVLPLVVLEACALFGVNQGAPLTAAANPGLHTFALEPFRFLGVLHIVLMHDIMDVRTKFGWQIVATFGKYWVQFFFALSGLVLFISQKGAQHVSNPGSFIMKRVWGIYPVYAFSILLAMSATEAPRSYFSELPHATLSYLWGDIMPGFLLVDSWAWPYGTQIPNGPAWFVCTLFVFWLCFPHWYGFLRGVRSPKLVMLFAYLSTFGLPVLYAALNVDGHCFPSLCANWNSFAEFHPFANWQVFVFGMCMGRVLQDTDSNTVPFALRRIGGTVSLLTLFSLPLFSPTPSDSVLTLFLDKGPLLLPIFAMLLYLVPLGDDILLKPALMESKLLAYAGAMSGHLFLLHIPVKLLLDRIAGSGAVPITAMLPSQLLFSIAVYEAHTRLLGPSRTAGLNLTPAEPGVKA